MKSFKEYYRICEKYEVLGRPIKFIRYGGLSRVKQKGFTTDPQTMHKPPSRNGIYAFVWPYFEPFLLNSPRLDKEFEYVKDGNGNIIDTDHPDYKKYVERYSSKINKQTGKTTLTKFRDPKIFEYYGPLWHHLSHFIDRKDVIKEHGAWVKTGFDAYVKALKKELHSTLRRDEFKEFRQENEPSLQFWQYRSKKPAQNFYRDHLEVFIDDKI